MIDVIIPCKNESLDTVIPTIEAWKAAQELDLVNSIIVVDDALNGCDYPLARAFMGMGRAFGGTDQWTKIIQGPRKGKGQAIQAGLKLVTQDRVAFCDADLHGFKLGHAVIMCAEYPGMLLAVTDYVQVTPWQPSMDTHALVTGERSLPTWLARSVDLHGYAMEVQLNSQAIKCGLPVQPVGLTGVKNTVRWTKERHEAMIRDGQWLRQNRG